MRALVLLPTLTVVLAAQEPLAARLQKIQRLPTATLRQLQGELALAELPAETKAYAEAHLAYVLGARLQGPEPKTAEALVDRAIALLEPRKDADSKALLGACLGVKIGFHPMSGMTLAPKASALFEAARKASPANPRVLLLQGVHALHTPAFFGGGAKAALPILEAAVKAAEAETAPENAWSPAWGKAESLLWLAKAQREGGDETAAQGNLKRALELDPAYGHAQVLLKQAAQ